MKRFVLGWVAGGVVAVGMLAGTHSAQAQTPSTPPVQDPQPPVEPTEPTDPQSSNDDEAARRHFRLGQAYYQNGQFPQAAIEFEQAYQLSGRPQLLYNIYLAHRDALHTRQSYEALRQYLDEVADPPDEDHLRARLHHLEEALAANPESDPEVQPDTETSDPTPTPVTTVTPDLSATAEPESSSPVPFVVMGAGGGMLVGGLVAALISRGARSDLDALCDADGGCPPDSNWESLRDKGQRSARTADVMIGVGAAAAVTGVVLYFVMRPGDDDERASSSDAESASVQGGFGCDATGCMATLGGQF
ncbi:MAG: tetratricopeptide repeat protein [Sandaracinaceae bacterium]|jgi:tetratricopeptide (TPR) repeat protein|nr:tetratricopeptide repeat protein [Sandaracinaceae bacterium]MBK8588290.1 tetratricopeptide repeat protein [Sandaracinaceae bacterium]